jgi:hypothetical protein
MRISRSTTVKEAVESSPVARELFVKHGIDPLVRCVGMDDLNTLDDAEQWCHITDVDGLIAELNAAIASGEAAQGRLTLHPATPAQTRG